MIFGSPTQRVVLVLRRPRLTRCAHYLLLLFYNWLFRSMIWLSARGGWDWISTFPAVPLTSDLQCWSCWLPNRQRQVWLLLETNKNYNFYINLIVSMVWPGNYSRVPYQPGQCSLSWLQAKSLASTRISSHSSVSSPFPIGSTMLIVYFSVSHFEPRCFRLSIPCSSSIWNGTVHWCAILMTSIFN